MSTTWITNQGIFANFSHLVSSFLTQPNMYARGILFGKMKYELGDHSFVRCPENGLVADVEFKTKGYFGGTYNAIGGVIRNEKTGESLYDLSGMWSGEMIAKNLMVHSCPLVWSSKLTKHRPGKRRFFLMRRMQGIRHRPSDRWRSKGIANRKSFGIGQQ